MSSYIYYTQEGSNYSIKENKIFSILGTLFFLWIIILFLINWEQVDRIPYWVFWILPFVIFLYKSGRKVTINTLTKTLEVSFFGIKTQQYPLSAYKQFLLVHHKAYYFFNNGQEVKAIFTINNELKEVSLLKKNTFTDSNTFIAETEKLLQQ